MTEFKLETMDGRQRGRILRDGQGKFTTVQGREKAIQNKINEYFKNIKHYQKYVSENPDLKVLIDAEKAKIADCEREMRLNKYSKRGINERVKLYEEAMKKQGSKGEALKTQVDRYKEGLKNECRQHFDKLKGKNIARYKGNLKPKPKGFFGKLVNFFKGKGGKVALVGAGIATIVGGAALLKGCDDKAAELTAAVPEETTKQVSEETSQSLPKETAAAKPETPVQTEDLAEKPTINKDDEYSVYKAVWSDTYWGYAKQELIKEHQGEVGYKPTDAEILARTHEIMKRNETGLADDSIHTIPPLIVGDDVKLKYKAA